jgi:hypothetical protein
MTRQCPQCGATGPATAFRLLPPAFTPARHDERRRACPSCGRVGRTWVFAPRPSTVPRAYATPLPGMPT